MVLYEYKISCNNMFFENAGIKIDIYVKKRGGIFVKVIRNQKIAIRIGLFMAVVLLIGFVTLWQVIGQRAAALMKQSITAQMSDAVETRTGMISEYINSLEDFLVGFGQGEEVRRVLSNPTTQNIKKAQKYTEDFANVKGIFEGLYIASPETYVYTHTSLDTVGIYCREGEGVKEFQELINKPMEEVTGIIESPNSGEMCISMCYPIYDEGKYLGYVGAAVYANDLMNIFTQAKMQGLDEYEYAFINVNSGVYLYNQDKTLLNTEVTDLGYLEVINAIKAHPEQISGIVDYAYEADDTDIIVYRYIPERNWVFLVKSCENAVYASVIDIKHITANLCFIVAIVTIGLIIFILTRLGKELELVEKAIDKLKQLDLSANHELRAYRQRKDEVGMICNALDVTCKSLKGYVKEINDQLHYMANGDYTAESTMEYVGDFKEIQGSMSKIQSALRESFKHINVVTAQLAMGSQNVSEGATNLAEVATEENGLIAEIENHVSEINEKVAKSSKNAMDAKQKTAHTTELIHTSKDAMDGLISAMNEIVESTNEIVSINSAMERIAKQTHILALNATVEASRAGQAGKGFAVVANEIKELAEKANDSASMTKDLIEHTIEAVTKGTTLSNQTAEGLFQVVEEANIIDNSVSEIAEASMLQSRQLKEIMNKLSKMSMVVETTAATAEESAAASAELDGQIVELRKNIERYRV